MCVRCVPVCAGSAYMRNAVNYLCAQYHHFLYMLSAWFGIGVKVPYVHWSIYQESKQMKKTKQKTSNNCIFIQTIYKLHSLNLNEGDALLLHLRSVCAKYAFAIAKALAHIRNSFRRFPMKNGQLELFYSLKNSQNYQPDKKNRTSF